ncbi:MAG: hypothetical protein C5B50_19305 [Verrucomicrobia bacterium]|nr:MAG: hypothetical protein C5B50_19305 [Verrucomicrobiota bacterium]
MNTEVQITRAREFVRLDTNNQLDLEESRSAIKALANGCREREDVRVLMDMRLAGGDVGPTDLAILVKAFCDIGFSSQQHLAVLHSSDQGYLDDMCASLSALHGWKIRPFEEFEEALDWLALNRDVLKEPALAPAGQQAHRSAGAAAPALEASPLEP